MTQAKKAYVIPRKIAAIAAKSGIPPNCNPCWTIKAGWVKASSRYV